MFGMNLDSVQNPQRTIPVPGIYCNKEVKMCGFSQDYQSLTREKEGSRCNPRILGILIPISKYGLKIKCLFFKLKRKHFSV
jgi:hypothetical protein